MGHGTMGRGTVGRETVIGAKINEQLTTLNCYSEL